MLHVFLLVVYIGTGESRYLASGDMYFKSVTTCNFFAAELSKRYGSYGSVDWMDPRDRVTAYCIPKYLKKGTVEVY
jgi:hypothetical protein